MKRPFTEKLHDKLIVVGEGLLTKYDNSISAFLIKQMETVRLYKLLENIDMGLENIVEDIGK